MTRARYVVADDGSDRGADALRLGVAMARSLQADLDVVLVLRTDDPFEVAYPPVGDTTQLVREQAQGWLDRSMASVPPDVDARGHLRTGPSVAGTLLEAVAELGASAIVVGAAPGRSARGLGVGPVASSLLHSSPVPVVLAPSGRPVPERIENLYAAVGTRPGGADVVDEAVTTAERSGLDLHLLSLLELDGEDDGSAVRRRTELLLDRARDRLPGRTVTVHVGHGRTLKKAVRSVHLAPASLVLVGSSRLAQGRRTFLSTTAARMLRHLSLPVAVVPYRPDTKETTR